MSKKLQVRITTDQIDSSIVALYKGLLVVRHTDADKIHVHYYGDCKLSENPLRLHVKKLCEINNHIFSVSKKTELFYQYQVKPGSVVLFNNLFSEEEIEELRRKNINYVNPKKDKHIKPTDSFISECEDKLDKTKHYSLREIIKIVYSKAFNDTRYKNKKYPSKNMLGTTVNTLYIRYCRQTELEEFQASEERLAHSTAYQQCPPFGM
jgi:hypothetical protein